MITSKAIKRTEDTRVAVGDMEVKRLLDFPRRYVHLHDRQDHCPRGRPFSFRRWLFLAKKLRKNSKNCMKNAWASKQKGPQCGGLLYSWALTLALQQAQHTLLGGISLCQHRGGRLLEDLRLGEVGAFCREVGILNAAFRRGDIGRDIRKVRDRVIEAI